MKTWLALLAALVFLGFAAMFALVPITSDCSTSLMPKLHVALVFLLLHIGAGAYLSVRGDAGQRMFLFLGSAVILLGYGFAMSFTLPFAYESAASHARVCGA